MTTWTITRYHHTEDTSTARYTTADVDTSIRTARRRGYEVSGDYNEITVRRSGVVTLVFVPDRAFRATAQEWRDLAQLARWSQGIRIEPTATGPRLRGGVYSVPPAAAARLMARGWITMPATPTERAQVSEAGRFSLAIGDRAQPALRLTVDPVIVPGHATTTATWTGPERPHFKSNGSGGARYGDPESMARCECGWGHHTRHRSDAQAAARHHRIEARAALTSVGSAS